MKLTGKGGLSRLLEVGMTVLMVLVVLLMISLPWSITWITERPATDPYYIRYLVILTYSGIMSELILWQGRGILRNINRNCVFCTGTVRHMHTMAIEFLVLAALYLVTMFWMSKFFMAVLFVCSVVAGCTMLVFAELFRQANEYKAEHDKTI